MKLSHWTTEALCHKATVADETYDADDDSTAGCLVTAYSCRSVASVATVEALHAAHDAQEELENYLQCHDLRPCEITAIVADLCRAGYFERFNPDTVHLCGRPTRTRIVDGVRFVTGY